MGVFKRGGQIVEEQTDYEKTIKETIPSQQHVATNHAADTPRDSDQGADEEKTDFKQGLKDLYAQTTGSPQLKRTSDDNPKTRLIGSTIDKDDKLQSAQDPVVGWLVIITGPGLGHAFQIGYGNNPIGRSDHNRISLPFNDDQISRVNHATVSYDPKGRKFYIQPGTGTNLTYLDESPVMQPTELTSGHDITIGSTTLRFTAFCGETFDWQNNQED